MARKDNPPSEDEYEYEEKKIIYSKAPHIYPCAKCGWPVESGFVCSTCGDSNPREP